MYTISPKWNFHSFTTQFLEISHQLTLSIRITRRDCLCNLFFPLAIALIFFSLCLVFDYKGIAVVIFDMIVWTPSAFTVHGYLVPLNVGHSLIKEHLVLTKKKVKSLHFLFCYLLSKHWSLCCPCWECNEKRRVV